MEYAARGGPRWRDGFRFSGSDYLDAVAWYDRQHGDHTQPVGLKAPNQISIHAMSGNVWELRLSMRSAMRNATSLERPARDYRHRGRQWAPAQPPVVRPL